VKRKILRLSLLALAATIAVLLALAPPALVNRAQAPRIDGDLEDWIASRESRVAETETLIQGTEKRVRWYHGDANSRTRFSIVYLHGFSATRQEIAPVGEWVADELQANLFETRLTGHGRERHALIGVRAEDWLEDAAEALAIGALIGEQTILIGTSTGATLALAMASHPAFEGVGFVVLMSPNFAPRDSNAEFLTWPGGPQLAYLVAGSTRSWTAENEQQARYWSTAYPMDAAIEMMRLVKYVRGELPLNLKQPLLVIWSPRDRVVDTAWIVRAVGQIESPNKQLVEVEVSGDPSNHVLAGDIMAPENNRLVTDAITKFVRSNSSAGR
jgi:esterase/lipase